MRKFFFLEIKREKRDLPRKKNKKEAFDKPKLVLEYFIKDTFEPTVKTSQFFEKKLFENSKSRRGIQELKS